MVVLFTKCIIIEVTLPFPHREGAAGGIRIFSSVFIWAENLYSKTSGKRISIELKFGGNFQLVRVL